MPPTTPTVTVTLSREDADPDEVLQIAQAWLDRLGPDEGRQAYVMGGAMALGAAIRSGMAVVQALMSALRAGSGTTPSSVLLTPSMLIGPDVVALRAEGVRALDAPTDPRDAVVTAAREFVRAHRAAGGEL